MDDLITNIYRSKNSPGRISLLSLTPRELEFHVAQLYKEIGYKVKLTRASADRGVDIIATKGRELLAVQVKRYNPSRSMGPKTVREYSALRLKGYKVVIVTTSSFSKQAREEAREFGTELIDGKKLVKLSDKYLRKYLPPPRSQTRS